MWVTHSNLNIPDMTGLNKNLSIIVSYYKIDWVTLRQTINFTFNIKALKLEINLYRLLLVFFCCPLFCFTVQSFWNWSFSFQRSIRLFVHCRVIIIYYQMKNTLDRPYHILLFTENGVLLWSRESSATLSGFWLVDYYFLHQPRPSRNYLSEK